jgi:hypothetical protein
MSKPRNKRRRSRSHVEFERLHDSGTGGVVAMPNEADQAEFISSIRAALDIPGDDTEYVAAFLLVMADVRDKHGRDLTTEEAIDVGNHWRSNAYFAGLKTQGRKVDIPVLTTRYELAEWVNRMPIFSLIVNPTQEQIQSNATMDAFLAEKNAELNSRMARRRSTSGCLGIMIALLLVIPIVILIGRRRTFSR